MAVLSGKNGTLYLDGAESTPVSNWTIDISGNLKAYAANDTHGWKRRVSGVNDATGTFLVRADDECNCPVTQGESYVAQLHVDDTLLNYYNLRIRIESIGVEDDIDDGEILNYTINWGGDGPCVGYGMLSQGIACSSSSGA